MYGVLSAKKRTAGARGKGGGRKHGFHHPQLAATFMYSTNLVRAFSPEDTLISQSGNRSQSQCYAMTLDILHFIEAKGGSPDEIRESQRKRGLSDEIVDEVAQMYADWVKRMHRSQFHNLPLTSRLFHKSRLRSFNPGKVSKPGSERDRRKEKGIPTLAILISIPPAQTASRQRKTQMISSPGKRRSTHR